MVTSKTRLLVVSDENIIPPALQERLIAQGYDLTFLPYSLEQIRLTSRKSLPHIIILRPGALDRVYDDEIYVDVSQTTHTSHIPFVFIVDQDDMETKSLLGIDAFVELPATSENFEAAIVRVTNHLVERDELAKTLIGHSRGVIVDYWPITEERLEELLSSQAIWNYIDIKIELSNLLYTHDFVRHQISLSVADFETIETDWNIWKSTDTHLFTQNVGHYVIVTFSGSSLAILDSIAKRIGSLTEKFYTLLELEQRQRFERTPIRLRIKMLSNASHRYSSVQEITSHAENS